MKKTLIKRVSVLVVVLISIMSCSPEDGADGTNGTNGTNGSNGTDGLNSLITTLIEQPGSNCSNGGFRIEAGLDLNDNGILETSEVDTSEFLCNADAAGLSYLSYVSLLNQTGTNDPQSSVLENTLGLNIVWTRESQGKYIGALDGTIDIGKTVIFYTTPTTHTGVRGEVVGNNQVRIELQNGINVFADDFSNLSFELREYE
ncbi:hypothetical protein [Flagellimonas sp. CMM7]|uniref:DUF7151 family protein n=1 Tax=Flagellimonas sp. CMM7 TaxID=2654676 RepID=UPI0013CF96E6|nr:hypothetical protein [Flagellimonas sp. CMM7]UII79151.1 hypothetical protein LV704_16005 [Flagellimonas sp. CMM7]